jgi:hypothetical protein
MNGSNDKATGAWEPSERRDILFNLATVKRMLPLVRSIVGDVLASQRLVASVTPELGKLDRQKRNLTWTDRQRRYQLQDQVDAADRAAHEAEDELHGLGVVLLDARLGRVGFPTLVNERPAYFSWHPGEDDTLHSWHFAEESNCRPIPAAWLQEISLSGKS